MPAEVIKTRRTTILRHHEEEVKIKSIVILPESFQTRETLDKGRSLRYGRAFQSGSVFPPVILKELPDGRRILVDGFHRVDFHIALGLTTIKAVIEPADPDDPHCGPEAQGILRGIQANMDQSKDVVVTDADKIHAAKIMIRNEQLRLWNNTTLGEKCGLSSQTVQGIRLRLLRDEGIPIPDKLMVFGRDGKPKGQWRVSSHKRGGRPTIQRPAKGNPVVVIGGEKTRFAAENAEEQVNSYIEERDRLVSLLSNSDRDAFSRWLMIHRVPTYRPYEGPNNQDKWMGRKWFLGSKILIPVKGINDFDGLRAAFCSAYFALKSYPEKDGVILVGFRKEMQRVVATLANAIEECGLPIVFRDPWEVADEFGEGESHDDWAESVTTS